MTSPPRDVQRAQFRQLMILIAVAFVDMIGFMLVLPVLPFYALRMEATPVVPPPAPCTKRERKSSSSVSAKPKTT